MSVNILSHVITVSKHVTYSADDKLTWPVAGGGMRDCGSGAIAPPHSLQKRANGSVGRGAKQLVHLQQFTHTIMLVSDHLTRKE